MVVRDYIGEKVCNWQSSRIQDKVKSGVEVLCRKDGWKEGKFSITVGGEEVSIHIEPIEETNQATVIASTSDETSREWAIPDSELESGLESTVGAVFDIM